MSTWTRARSLSISNGLVISLPLGLFVFLLLYWTRAAEQTRDSLVYAYSARTGFEIFHPHHLIYTPAIRWFYQAFSGFCPACDAVFAAQIHNTLWSVAGVLAIYFLVKSIWNDRAALPAALVFLTLRGFWELSTQTTMYAPGASILAVITALLVTGQKHGTSPSTKYLAGILFALAVLYHQANILFALPLAAYLIARQQKKGLKQWLAVTSIAGALCLASYLVVYLINFQTWSADAFIRFCLSYTNEICLGGQCKASPDNWGSLANLSPTGLKQLLSSLVWNLTVIPPFLEGTAGAIFGLILLALSAWHILQIRQKASGAPLRIFFLTWQYSYILFFFWWLPSYQHPFVVILVPLLLLIVLAVKDATAPQGGISCIGPSRYQVFLAGGLALLALAFAARNFQARILPLHTSRGDAYVEAAELNALAPEGCILLTSYHTWNHLRYYFNREMVFQIRHPMSFIYLDQPLPTEYRIADQPCVLIAATFLWPEYTNEDYEDGGLNGYETPSRWLAFLSWVFDFHYEDRSELISHRDFQVIQISDGVPYIRLMARKSAPKNLIELFAHLDATLQEPDRPFQTWYYSVQ